MIKFYRDAVVIYRWGFRFNWRWIRGLGVGVEVYPSRWPGQGFLGHTKMELRLLALILTIEHILTSFKPLPWWGREGKDGE